MSVAVLAATCLATTASGAVSHKKLPRGGTLVYADNIGPITMNPLQMGNGTAGTYAEPAYDSLIAITPSGKLVPDLATKWGYVRGTHNTKFELKLRKGVRFSTGTVMTSKDVVSSIDYALKNAYFSFTLSGVTKVIAAGPHEVLLTLSSPNPELPYALDQYWQQGDIIAPAAVKHPSLLLGETLGTGPYKLLPSQTISGVQYTYVPNSYYWNKAAIRWNKIVIKVFTDADSALQALESGQVQAMVGDVPIAKSLGANKSVKVLSNPTGEAGIVIEDEHGKIVPALGKLKVRQAMNYAVNRTAINGVLSGKFGKPLDEIQGKGFVGFVPSLANHYRYSVKKAKSLLAAAGYPHGFSMSLLVQEGSVTTLEAQLFASQMSKIGIKVKIKQDADTTQFLTDANTLKYSALAPVLNMGPPFFTYEDDFGTNGNLWNLLGATYPEQSLINEANASPKAKASKIWQKVWGYMTTDAVWVPLSQAPAVFFVGPKVTAVAPNQELNLSPVAVTPKR